MSKRKSLAAQRLAGDILFDLLGCTMVAVGVVCFSSPNNIAPGGVTGISIMINHMFGLPISVMTMSLNIPLLILSWFFLGHIFALKTFKSVVILTVMIEIATQFMPVYQGNALLAALFGGVIDGIGLALVFMRSSTTGGSDIVSRLIQLKFPTVQVGKLMMAVNACVLLTAAIVYRSIENSLLGLVAMFASTTIVDRLLYGRDTGKLMMIMTRKPEEVSAAVISRLHRGCTLLDGKGAFSKREQPVLLCVVRKAQYFDLKRIVDQIDPAAFMISMEAGEVIGEGFKDIAESTKIQ